MFFPINFEDSHWSVAVFKNADRSLCYYDSLEWPPKNILKFISKWLVEYAKSYSLGSFISSEDNISLVTYNFKNKPQSNSCDSGVFVLKFIEAICAENSVEDILQDSMPGYRKVKVLYKQLSEHNNSLKPVKLVGKRLK